YAMSDEDQDVLAQNTSIQPVPLSNVTAHPEHPSPWSLEDSQKGSLELTRAPLMGTDPDEFPILLASPAWTSEVTAPNQTDALSYLRPRDNGALRVGLVAGALIIALGLGWGAVLSLHIPKSNPG